jgi:hypothetical protein
LVKTMKFDADVEPFDFAQRFLQLHGAAVERDDSVIEALIPEKLCALLDTPEHIRISGGAGGADQYSVTYGAPLLERMIGGAMDKIPLVDCRLEFDYVKSGGFERLLEEQLVFYGAVSAVETVAEVKTEYALISCRYTAQSDEQKEGMLDMAFNTQTGAFVPDLGRALESAGCRMAFAPADGDARRKIASLGGAVERQARSLLQEHLESFRQGMNRRFRRDMANLREYYSSLEAEMRNSLDKAGLSEGARSDRQAKIDALPAELASKTDDLFKKYSIKVRLFPAAAMLIRTPAKKIVCKLSIGRQTRQIFLTYNPVRRAVDPLSCCCCQKPLVHIHFNAGLEPVCFDCR